MKDCLLGAAGGDICGSFYENKFCRIKTDDLSKITLIKTGDSFTDDTVCTMGVADALVKYDTPTVRQFSECIQKWCQDYPNRGYGGMFKDWILNPEPYGSYGNGSAMRVSPIGFWAKDEDECIELATRSAMCSHNHPEGIKGAVAIALSIFRAKDGNKEGVNNVLAEYYPSYTGKSLSDIRPEYKFDATCQGSVPIAILAFLEGDSYENCLKLAISMGGDSDTLAAMAGGIAYAYYKNFGKIKSHIISALSEPMLILNARFKRKS